MYGIIVGSLILIVAIIIIIIFVIKSKDDDDDDEKENDSYPYIIKAKYSITKENEAIKFSNFYR